MFSNDFPNTHILAPPDTPPIEDEDAPLVLVSSPDPLELTLTPRLVLICSSLYLMITFRLTMILCYYAGLLITAISLSLILSMFHIHCNTKSKMFAYMTKYEIAANAIIWYSVMSQYHYQHACKEILCGNSVHCV